MKNGLCAVVVGGVDTGSLVSGYRIDGMGTPTFAASLSAATKIKEQPLASDLAIVPPAGRAQKAMRKYRISYLNSKGAVHWTEQIAPAKVIFEQAFSAFTHGTPIMTPDGPVAVQDLEPGMSVTTSANSSAGVLWIGSMTMIPKGYGIAAASTGLTRVMPDSFGLSRPDTDLLVGPGARFLARPPSMRDTLNSEQILTPAYELADSMTIINVMPPRPIAVYHLALESHAVIKAAGMEMESFHPGKSFERMVGPNTLTLFLSLFPHIREPSDFGDLHCPRLPLQSA
ncbi:MAG: Hint domain-containing protein [Pseudomonadota bacterium]